MQLANEHGNITHRLQQRIEYLKEQLSAIGEFKFQPDPEFGTLDQQRVRFHEMKREAQKRLHRVEKAERSWSALDPLVRETLDAVFEVLL